MKLCLCSICQLENKLEEASNVVMRLDALTGELTDRLPADDSLAEWAERYGNALVAILDIVGYPELEI